MLCEKFSVITDQGTISISKNHYKSLPTNKMILHYIGEKKKKRKARVIHLNWGSGGRAEKKQRRNL